MKTLTAFTAAAALIAAVSVASAAGVTGNGKFCLKSKSGATTCEYASIEACQKVAKPDGGTCISNVNSATTGSGSSSSLNKMEKK